MKTMTLMAILLLWAGLVSAGVIDEATALKTWLTVPFSSTALEAERDAQIRDLQNPVKGEFETKAQFEQRKLDATNRITALRAEYDQRIRDARAAHENNVAKLRQRLQTLLQQSRETVNLDSNLGPYDSETQTFKISIPEKTFSIVVPLDKGPGVKQNIGKYTLRVTRQLDENLQWTYLEARLEGEGASYSSTDKAPALGTSVAGGAVVPPDLVASRAFSEPGGNDFLDAEETAQVTITVKNNGKGSAKMVEANCELLKASGVTYERQLYFGEIKPGETTSKTLQLVAGTNLVDAQAELKISFTEQNGFPPDPIGLSFETRALRPPDIYVADIGISDFNQNRKIETAEPVEITVRVHNKGAGSARNVTAEVLRGELVYPTPESPGNEFPLGDLAPGAYKDFTFGILAAKTATSLDLKVNLKESRPQFNKSALPLNLALNKVERTADQLVIRGKASSGEVASAPALTSDVDRDIPTLAQPDSKRWGVIIGIENYQKVDASVPFARSDAEVMKDYFVRVLGIPAENIYVKTNDGASQSEFNTLFKPSGKLAKNAANKGSEIFVYYSGHGVPDNNGAYLLPYDGNPDFPALTGYNLQQLYTDLGSLQAAHVTLFLDSCFSGRNRDNQSILSGAKALVASPELPAVAPNMTVFSAAGSNQMANVYADQRHGLFSYYLMKGLRGEADLNKNKSITQQELKDYLAQNVSALSRRLDREQDPQLLSSEPDRVLVRLK